MTLERNIEYLISLAHELRNLPKETEWVEFKHNNDRPDDIGQYLSSLSNSAALAGKAYAYLIWGIDDKTHDIIGTNFSPSSKNIGTEELESWLLKLIAPKINFRFFEVQVDEQELVLLEIPRAFRHPVQFKGIEYIRVGSYQKKLKEFPEKERELWKIFDNTPFENHIAAEELTYEEIAKLLDVSEYFNLLGLPLPMSIDNILEYLSSDGMIIKSDSGLWHISNMGAVLLAKQLSDFSTLRGKAVRVIQYKGNSRIETLREQDGVRGYACGFERLISFANNLLPSNEVIEKALRKTVPMYPEIAVRELIANALIHQNFFIGGAGPLIEIFSDRMEITNPGKPLVEPSRFLDSPPRSRNDSLASFMRRIGVCELRGSGVDKVVSLTEDYQLPAPLFEVVGDNMRVVLFAHRKLSNMAKEDRIRACYLHACLRYVNRDNMTNASLRERFGIEAQNSAVASRIIRDTISAKMIKPYDKDAGKKYMRYIPIWA